jgi:hypothetical protein
LRIPSLALGIGAQPVMVIDENGKVEPFKSPHFQVA